MLLMARSRLSTTKPRDAFSSRPKRELKLPKGPRRLLVIETDQDVTLLDLDNARQTPARPEITVRLRSGSSAAVLRPAGVVIDDGEPNKADDARIGVRVQGASNAVTLTLVASEEGAPNDFRPELNLTELGGEASDIAFVRTELGLRLAALVPSIKSALLIEPETSLTTKVDLPADYTKMSLVTGDLGVTSSGDVILLVGASGVAFWSLGRTTGQPYRSVEALPLSAGVSRVIDVPKPQSGLKVLRSGDATSLFVLDVAKRTASPLSGVAQTGIHVSSDGARMWLYPSNGGALAQVGLNDLHPVMVPMNRSISSVFDLARPDGGRSLVAIDGTGSVGATVLDAVTPNVEGAASYYGLLLEDLPCKLRV
jgi:hypothetical protein